MFGLGPMEMLIVGVIAVLLFGNRLPEVGRSLGKGLVEFKKGIRGDEDPPDEPPKDNFPKDSGPNDNDPPTKQDDPPVK